MARTRLGFSMVSVADQFGVVLYVEQLADLLRISVAEVRNRTSVARRTGEFRNIPKPRRVGRRLAWLACDVDAWLNSLEAGA